MLSIFPAIAAIVGVASGERESIGQRLSCRLLVFDLFYGLFGHLNVNY
ncbi:hypothetical protein [Chamaesiphon sp. VAR_48_metabat_135_sub]|nr:hypothetical protein [Chamaesiphon sp. VAR_48_metabat_135_sub]